MFQDTIAAIATPLGEGGIGIVRISGPISLKIAKQIFKPSQKQAIKPQKAIHGWVNDKDMTIDEAVITYFKAPRSYTGEDIIEISCHGGTSVLKSVLNLSIKRGARLADRGEFTKKAFLNGKIDLAQAEAVIDLVKARTKETSIIAASQLKGSLSTRIRAIRECLLDITSELEASNDFPDEMPKPSRKRCEKAINAAILAVDKLIVTGDIGKLLREGVAVAIAGKPNVGKSSLLNAILREERAIVAEQPGTTRDIIDEKFSIKGIPVRVIDTAGIRRSGNKIEELGINRAKKAIEEADVILLVLDISQNITREDKELLKKTSSMPRIVVLNKADLKHKIKPTAIKRLGGNNIAVASALRGSGIDGLEKSIFDLITENKVVAKNTDIMINLRQRQCLEKAKERLEKSMNSNRAMMQADFITIDIKGAIAALGEVTGEAVSEEVIDRIFERFCVGK